MIAEEVERILSKKWFCSLDLCGDENGDSVRVFEGLYRMARSKGLVLKAHVGEFGTADDVWEAVEVLGLDEIHHGIASVKSPQLLHWLADHGICLNICPASNIKLGLVGAYESHPIRKIYDSGVNITINTDDLLIFDVSVSQEYLHLYNKGVFTAKELDEVRLFGLTRGSGSISSVG